MPIQATCQSCGKTYGLKEEFAGKKIRCPACKAAIEVPAAAPVRPSASSSAPPPAASLPSQRSRRLPPPSTRPPGLSAPPAPVAPPSASAARPPASVSVKTSRPDGGMADPTDCPHCGKPLDGPVCGACGFNVRLRRKLGLSSAIADASREKGVRADGSRFVTREERSDARQSYGRTIAIAMIVLAVIVVAGGFFISGRIINKTIEGEPVEVLRKKKFPNHVDGRAVTSQNRLHPFFVAVPVDLTVPRSALSVEKPAQTPPGAAGPEAGAALAEAMLLPAVRTYPDRIYRRELPSVLKRNEERLGRFSSAALREGVKLPSGKALVCRQAPQALAPGFLTGFLLDCDVEGEEGKLARLRPNAMVRVQGTLYFVVSRLRDFPEASGYMRGLRRGLTSLPPPPAPAAPPPKAKTKGGKAAPAPAPEKPEKKEKPPAPVPDDPENPQLFFHPVVVVSSIEAAPAATPAAR